MHVEVLFSALVFAIATTATVLDNSFCTDSHFQKEWLGKDKHGALHHHDHRTSKEQGWETLLRSEKPMDKWGVCSCHNAAFTDDSEQWDGVPSHGMEEMRAECYFSLPQCAQYFKTGNCPGASPSLPSSAPLTLTSSTTTTTSTSTTTTRPQSQSLPPTKILVATMTPYTINQLSNKQAGRCSARCDFQHPVPGQPIHIDTYDGIVWPLDWSFGTSNTLHVPTNIDAHVRARQVWIGFTEEDMFKSVGGRPDLWSNQTFLQQFDLLSSYDYGSADLPFNLWKMHFFRSCTPNVYFAPPPNHFSVRNVPLVSYVSRNCRQQRDAWVLKLSKHITVASIGKCLHNYDWPFPKKSYPYWLEKVLALRRFPFALAIEGSDEPGKSGLVSEKLFDAFAAGTVPIYWGAPRQTVEKLAPSPESFIHVDDFDGDVAKLSEYLQFLSQHPTEYMKHHAWRKVGPTSHFCSLLETNINTLACRMCQRVTQHKKNLLKREKKRETAVNMEINAVGELESESELELELEKEAIAQKKGRRVYAVVVKSAGENVVLRQTIRNTWGNQMNTVSNNHQVDVSFHFLVSSSQVTPVLQEEMNEKGDIVITSRTEGEALLDYAAVLMKTTTAATVGTRVQYLMVMNDDVMIHFKDTISLLEKRKRRDRLYMGLVEEYELNGAPVKVDPSLNGDLLLYPVHANADHMYVLSGDVVKWLSDNVKYLSNGSWMKSDPKKEEDGLNAEGPILASWLNAIQVHAQRGCADCSALQWSSIFNRNAWCAQNSLSSFGIDIRTLNSWKMKCIHGQPHW